MELGDGVYGLALDAELGGRQMTLNAAAVETPRGLVLVDVGLPGGLSELEATLADEGLDLDDTWGVLVTHQDLDHVGCLAAVVERTGAVVFAHEAEVPFLEGDRELLKSSDERPMELDPVTVDVQLAGGEAFATAAGPMQVLHTPGHTPGHLSCLFPDAELLVSADALTAADGVLNGPREDVTPDLETAWESVAALADRDVEHTLCFHGGYVESGSDRLAALVADR